MISVIIPTLNAEATLVETLGALVPAAVAGLVREVFVVDGGSSDLTPDIVDHAGANLVQASPGRGHQLQTGAARALSVVVVPARRHRARVGLGA